ncbi:M48 family metallopeptidase [Thauera aromatica]|nr:M48 family metallopeptidase [Thauera aromatica]MCK2096507.1 M48 family metallopeptidase [Thauera aromatica]
MNHFQLRKSVPSLRARLACRLAWAAAGGLASIAALSGLFIYGSGQAFVLMWAAVGLGQPLATLLAAVAGLGGLLAAGTLLRVLSSPAPRIEGICLPRAAAQEFFRLLDDLTERSGVPAVHCVRITAEINAAVVQRPRLGGVGGLRTELLVGLPLVHSLSPAQLAAVLAHEFGHLAAQRCGWCAQGAHLRAWWMRALDEASACVPLLKGVIDRLSAGFCADMLRLSRLEEFEADALAARLVGAQAVGDALAELSRRAEFLEHDYWPRVLARHEADAASPVRPFREMGTGMDAGFSASAMAAAAWTAEAEVGAAPFHPPLRRRLRALRVSAAWRPQEATSAARHFFPELLPALAWVFDRAWWEFARVRRHPMVLPD